MIILSNCSMIGYFLFFFKKNGWGFPKFWTSGTLFLSFVMNELTADILEDTLCSLSENYYEACSDMVPPLLFRVQGGKIWGIKVKIYNSFPNAWL